MNDSPTIDNIFDPASIYFNGAPNLIPPPSAHTSVTGDPQSNENISQAGLDVPVITVDPTGSIQDAFDKLKELGGGIINLLAGTYVIKTALLGYSSITLKGISPSVTILDFSSTSANLSFLGTNIYSTGTISSVSGGVNVTGSGTSWLANVSAGQHLFIGTRWYLIAAVTSDTTLILAEAYSDTVTMPGAAYRIATVAIDFKVENLTLKSSTGTALVITDARQHFLTDVLLLSNNKGIVATNISEEVVNQMIIAASTSNGAELTNFGTSSIKNLNVIGNGGTGVVLNNIRRAVFSESFSSGNTGDGINITTGSFLTFGNSVEYTGNGGQGMEFVSNCDNIDITSATIQSNTSDGLKFTATTTNVHIYGCDIRSNGGYGANVATSSDQNIIFTTNNFASNSSGAINDLGTTTLIRGNTGVSDNAISALPALGLFGAGSDGDLAVTSGTTTLTSNKFYSSVTVSAGAVLELNGYILYVSGTLNNSGTIRNNGGNGGNGASGDRLSGVGATGGTAGSVAPGGTLAAGKAGATGATGAISGGGGSNGVNGTSANPALGGAGANGGAGGGSGTGGTGGTVTGETVIAKAEAYEVTGNLTAGSVNSITKKLQAYGSSSSTALSPGASGGSGASTGAGANTATGGGGGGGASGGVVLIIASIIVNSGIISANGGNGGNAGSTDSSLANYNGSGGGGGGGGGSVLLFYESLTNTGSVVANGGTGGTGAPGAGSGSSGQNGSSGSAGSVFNLRITS